MVELRNMYATVIFSRPYNFILFAFRRSCFKIYSFPSRAIVCGYSQNDIEVYLWINNIEIFRKSQASSYINICKSKKNTFLRLKPIGFNSLMREYLINSFAKFNFLRYLRRLNLNCHDEKTRIHNCGC